MRHTLRNVTAMSVIMILFSFFTSCQRDDALSEPEKSFALKSTQRYVLSEQETAQAISMYNNQMNKVSNHSDFTFDGIDFVKLQDRYGKQQYTFMIEHIDDTDLKFHNVIITDWGGLKKTVLVSYEMTETFSDSFNTGRLGFDSFSGTITYTLLTADAGYPCGESPTLGIPMVGGSGPGTGGGSTGGGGGGGGQPWDPNGNGNPHNQDVVDAQYLMMEMAYLSSQLAAPLYGHQSSRNIGTIGSITVGPEPYVELPPIAGTTNPCGDGSDQVVLIPYKPTEQDLCDELKAKSQNPQFQAKMDELKTKAGTQNFESAYNIYQNAVEGTLFSGEYTGNTSTANGGQVNLKTEISSTQSSINCIGFMHCHLDNGTTFKIFSYSDIFAFVQMAKVSTRPTEELCLYVTTASGTFALKINNEISLTNKLETTFNPYLGDTNERTFDKYVKTTDNVETQIKGFLNYLKKMGLEEINLYQQDSNNDWKKLELNTNGTTYTPTNC